MGKTAHDLAPLDLLGRLALLGVLNKSRKILFLSNAAGNMLTAGVTRRTGGVQPVLVAVLGRHDAVGSHENRAVEGLKLLLLLPPGVAVVAHKVGVLLEGGIVVGGEHFTVGIYVHPSALGLLQQHLQIPQIVTGNQDAGVFAHTDGYLGDLGVSVGLGVCFVQQRHSLHAVLAGLHGQGNQIVCRQAVIQSGRQGPLEKSIHLAVVLKQGIGVLGVGGQAFQTVGDELPQRADVLVGGGQNTDRLGLVVPVAGAVPARGGGQPRPVQPGAQGGIPLQSGADAGLKCVIIKVGVGDGYKQVFGHQPVVLWDDGLALVPQGGRELAETPGHIDEQILERGGAGALAADARPGAAGAASGLLTLITKHVKSSLYGRKYWNCPQV